MNYPPPPYAPQRQYPPPPPSAQLYYYLRRLKSSLFEDISPANLDSTLKKELNLKETDSPTFNGFIPGTSARGFGWNGTGSTIVVGVGEENKKQIDTYNNKILYDRQSDGLVGPQSPPPPPPPPPPPQPQSQGEGGQFVYYYRMGGDGKKYEIATPAILNAINDVCTHRYGFQPPPSQCAPNAFETATIRFVDPRYDKTTRDWMADIEMVVGNQIKTVLQGLIVRAGPTMQQIIKKYNDEIDKNYAIEGARMNEGLGGAKKKHGRTNRRTKRRRQRRKASRHKASRRKVSRRKASRRSTSKK